MITIKAKPGRTPACPIHAGEDLGCNICTAPDYSFTFVEFELDGGVIAPDQLRDALIGLSPVPADGGVIISGRGPVWLFAAMAHALHATRWVACFDPRLGGGVVVQRHHADSPAIGEVVPLGE